MYLVAVQYGGVLIACMCVLNGAGRLKCLFSWDSKLGRGFDSIRTQKYWERVGAYMGDTSLSSDAKDT